MVQAAETRRTPLADGRSRARGRRIPWRFSAKRREHAGDRARTRRRPRMAPASRLDDVHVLGGDAGAHGGGERAGRRTGRLALVGMGGRRLRALSPPRRDLISRWRHPRHPPRAHAAGALVPPARGSCRTDSTGQRTVASGARSAESATRGTAGGHSSLDGRMAADGDAVRGRDSPHVLVDGRRADADPSGVRLASRGNSGHGDRLTAAARLEPRHRGRGDSDRTNASRRDRANAAAAHGAAAHAVADA